MENTGANLKLPRYKTVLLNSGGLLYCVWFCFALLYAERVSELVGFTAAVILLPCCTLAAAALVPVLYVVVNKTKSSFWGRYHFTLAAVVLVMALCCATLWSANPQWAYGAKVTLCCLCMLLLGAGAILLTYITYSVNARLIGDEQRSGHYKTVFQIVGFVIGFILTVCAFYGFSAENVGYVLGCCILAVGGSLYFAGVSYIPRFMRPLTRKVTLKTSFKAFFQKPNAVGALSFVAYFLANAACVVFFAFLKPLTGLHSLAQNSLVALLSAATAAGLIAYAWGVRKRLGEYAALAGGLLCALSLAAFVLVMRIAALQTLYLQMSMALTCAACGFGLGLTLSSATVRADKISLRGTFTPGIYICLKGMTLICAIGMGVGLSVALLYVPATVKDIVFAAVLGAFAIAAAVLLAVARKLYMRRLESSLEQTKPVQKSADEVVL